MLAPIIIILSSMLLFVVFQDGAADALLPAERRGRHAGLQLHRDEERDQGLQQGRQEQGLQLPMAPMGDLVLKGGEGKTYALS